MSIIYDKSIGVYRAPNNDEGMPDSPRTEEEKFKDYKIVLQEKLKEAGIANVDALIFSGFCSECHEMVDNGMDSVCLVNLKGGYCAGFNHKEVVFFAIKCPKCWARCRILLVKKKLMKREFSGISSLKNFIQ